MVQEKSSCKRACKCMITMTMWHGTLLFMRCLHVCLCLDNNIAHMYAKHRWALHTEHSKRWCSRRRPRTLVRWTSSQRLPFLCMLSRELLIIGMTHLPVNTLHGARPINLVTWCVDPYDRLREREQVMHELHLQLRSCWHIYTLPIYFYDNVVNIRCTKVVKQHELETVYSKMSEVQLSDTQETKKDAMPCDLQDMMVTKCASRHNKTALIYRVPP